MSASTSTRRAMLGAMVALPTIALVASPASALGSSDWAAAYLGFQRANAEWDEFISTVHNPAVSEINRLAPTPALSWEHEALSGQVRTFRFDTHSPDEWDDVDGPIAEKGRAVKARYLAWREKYDGLCEQFRLDAIGDEDERLCNLMVAARETAIRTPARSVVDVLAKAEMIKDQFGDAPDEEHLELVLIDLRYLASQRER